MLATPKSVIASYRQAGPAAEQGSAQPQRIVLMLFDGAIENLSRARGALQRGDIAEKCSCIGVVLEIVGALRQALNLEEGGAIAANLDALYDYVIRILVEANRQNDAGKVEEARQLILEVRTGWAGLASDEA